MKKLGLVAALAGAATLSYGRGYVQTANTSTTKVSAGGAPATGLGTNTYLFEILVAPSTTTNISASLAGWTDTGDYLQIMANGRVGPANNTPDQLGSEIPGYAPGATADFAVVGWSANLGNYADALLWWNEGGALAGNPGADPGLAPGTIAPYF